MRNLRVFGFICTVAVAAGCSQIGKAASQPSEPSAQPSTAAASPSAWPTPVAKLTAACPLLSADELKTLLGGGKSTTQVTAVEDKPDVTDGYTSYNCKYGSGGKYPFGLGVQGIAQHGFTPAVAVDAIAKSAHAPTKRVTGVGTAGVFYTGSDGVALLAAAKQSHGETRTVYVTTPVVVPESKLVDIARVVLARV